MKGKIVILILAIAVVVGLTMGCDSSGKSQEAAAVSTVQNEGMTFVIVPKVVHAWFDEVNKGAVKQAGVLSDLLGAEVEIDYRAPQNADVVEQNTVLEQAAATRPDGIALDPLDYEGSKAVIEEIQARGIPVILFDSPAPKGSGLLSVGNNFSEQAALASDKLAEIIGFKGKVAVMQGFPSAPNHAERYQSHLDTLAQYPNIEVIEGGISNDSMEEAQSQAASVMAANPDLVGYLNCDATSSGIAAAIEEAGKKGKVEFVSMDNLIEILEYVKSGTITATSSTRPQMQGSMAVMMLFQAAIAPELELPKIVDTGIAYIDKTNIDHWIDMVGAK